MSRRIFFFFLILLGFERCWLFSAHAETLGPSNRRSGLVVSEIFNHPPPRADGKSVEFVEVYNSNPFPEDLGGFRFSGDIDFTFPAGTWLPGKKFVVVAKAPPELKAAYGITNVLGPYVGTLSNNKGFIQLHNRFGAVLWKTEFQTTGRWPVAANGAGHSLVLDRPSFGEESPEAWAPSQQKAGSPGVAEPPATNRLAGVVLNEFLANTDAARPDFVELYNHNPTEVDLSGTSLTDDPAIHKFELPNGTKLAPGGHLVFLEAQLGFSLKAEGETLFFLDKRHDRVLDVVRFGGQARGMASGRYPDGSPDFQPLTSATPGAPNARANIADIVINELMYHPISEDSNDEFIELLNKGNASINVSGWRLDEGLDFELPAGSVIPPGGFLVIAKNRARLLTHYAPLNATNTVGDYEGSLSNSGEEIRLLKPESTSLTNETGGMTQETIWVEVDRLHYRDGGRWGKWSDGGGSSLELRDPHGDNRKPSLWGDSDESAKSEWTTVQHRGVLDLSVPAPAGTPDELQIALMGAGEALVDDVVALDVNGINRVPNSTFEGGTLGWFFQGTHEKSSAETGVGFNSLGSLHIRATKRGDTGANRIRSQLLLPFNEFEVATIGGKVRWLRGHPEILFRFHGSMLEAAGVLKVPKNLGTPGQPNSQLAASGNCGPSIENVSHFPLLPAGNEAVRVTARVEDVDGVGNVTLNYRLDAIPLPIQLPVAMVDDGSAGDLVARDGIYTGMIPGQAVETLVAFSIQAVDLASTAATNSFPADAPTRECLVRFGETLPSLGVGAYRVWITQTNISTWASREKMNNTPLDVTFIYNQDRVIYNAGALYSGSSAHSPNYTAPNGTACDYGLAFPSDDPFLGQEDFVIALVGQLGDDTSMQREQTALWLNLQLGVPTLYRRYVKFYFNGLDRGALFEDTQWPDSDLIESWFPQATEGDLFKISIWSEFDDVVTRESGQETTLQHFTTPSPPESTNRVMKDARYRWNWRKRALNGSAHDFQSLYELIAAANTADTNQWGAAMEVVADVDEWMRFIAVQHVIGNVDGYGYNRGHNCYAYTAPNFKWLLLPWDVDLSFGSANSVEVSSASLFATTDPILAKMYAHPHFRRSLLRAYHELFNGPLLPAQYNPILDGKYEGLLAGGITVTDPSAIKGWLQRARGILQSTLSSSVRLKITTNEGRSFSTTNNLAALAGTAPVPIKTIRVNGVQYTPRWTGVTEWALEIPLNPGVNNLRLQGFDAHGKLVPPDSPTISISYNGVVDSPLDKLVINEIMYHASVEGGEFIELFNASTGFTFDLSRHQLQPVGFTFPDGTFIKPGQFLLVSANPALLKKQFPGIPVPFGPYPNDLKRSSDTIRLTKLSGTNLTVVIDEVTYRDDLPWPVAADGTGPSLQLMDPSQENSRPANWKAAATGALATPGRTNSVLRKLPSISSLIINEVQTENASGIVDGAGAREPWIELYNRGTQSVSLDSFYLSTQVTNLPMWRFPTGTRLDAGKFLVLWVDGEIAQTKPGEIHTNFRLSIPGGDIFLTLVDEGDHLVTDSIAYERVGADRSFGRYPDGRSENRWFSRATPGGLNETAWPFTSLQINEWMADNAQTFRDPDHQEFADWFEIYNSDSRSLDLSGFTLSDDLTHPTKWRFPFGTIIPARGYLLVWADEDSGTKALHVNFKLAASGDRIALYAPDRNLVDLVNFPAQRADQSQGRFPDGSSAISFLEKATPGSPNQIQNNFEFSGVERLSGSRLQFSWMSQAGARYQLQYKEDLNQANWQNLGNPVTGTGQGMSLEVTMTGIARRFFRMAVSD